MSTDLQQQFVHDMLTESQEGLDRYERAILLVESGTANTDTLNDIFRVIHTLKGTAGCLGFHQIEKLAHAGENLLDLLRSGKLAPNSEIASTLLQLSDALRALLGLIETSGEDAGGADPAGLISDLQTLREGGKLTRAAAAAPAPAPAAGPAPASDGSWGLFNDAPGIDVPQPVNSAWGLFDAPGEAAAPAAPLPPDPAPVANAAPEPPAPAAWKEAVRTVRTFLASVAWTVWMALPA